MAAEPNSPQNNSNDSKGSSRIDQGLPRWTLWVIAAVVVAAMLASLRIDTSSDTKIEYTTFIEEVNEGSVDEVLWDNTTSRITGTYKDSDETFETTGPPNVEQQTLDTISSKTNLSFETPNPSIIGPLIQMMIPIMLLIGIFVWMQRRAQGQMSGVMSIGRSKAKTYSTERPASTFADVAGYEGVKREVREVVDFLREPERFGEIGARIPKGVLLVGPPGTGKTLIARAVAGEAGVPFLSVSGSDFMEMFVGVGASRVRDLFESARKMGRAIIFIDEIDSIGRKRGAGMGGGNDEREQTLNQMLNEMDGFETSEGIVMIAATNRPDVLDPALLRPGRFDRQVVVPLPELQDRREILEVHIKHKRMTPDIDLETVARGTPGMSGAEIANLVNEAALHAVRNERDAIGNDDFEYARDRVLMGQRRESMVLSDHEKELTAYHEAGHAICASVLPTADPLHKVTILPIGMALGVTQQLPSEDRHSYDQLYLEESIIVAMGGRIAEKLIFGLVSTGANNDLVVSTERARKMVREWGMSPRIGPMAWGGQGQVFLGESLVSQPEYSEDTARVVDEEVERILRECETACEELLQTHRHALDLVARGLLEYETISGGEVARLVAMAAGESAGADAPTTASPAPNGGSVPEQPPASGTVNEPAGEPGTTVWHQP